MQCYALLLLAIVSVSAQTDPREIVQRSVSADDRSWQLARNYTYVERSVARELDSNGNVTASHAQTREVLYIDGRPFRRLVEKDGRPLTPAEEKKERERLDKVIAARTAETAAERARHIAESEQRRAKGRDELKQIPAAFDFKLVREEQLESGPAYVIEARPRAGYRGRNQDILSRMQGTLWIDKSDYHWVKVEAETLDTISFGLFIARLAKGSHLAFQEVRVNNELWLPRSASVTASARLALVKKLNLEQETTWSNYRKFQADSRLSSATGIEQK